MGQKQRQLWEKKNITGDSIHNLSHVSHLYQLPIKKTGRHVGDATD